MALRALKTEEEIAAIPLDQEILVELPGAVAAEAGEGDGKAADTATIGAAKDDIPGAKSLQDQLDALKAAETEGRRRIETAERERDEARRLAATRENENRGLLTAQERLEADTVSSGLLSAQANVRAAKTDLIRAKEAGDFTAEADAQERIAREAQRVQSFELAAAELAERQERRANEPAPQQQQIRQQPVDVTTSIEANPNLLPAEKEWLKAHSEVVIDPARNNELGVAYTRAVRAGHERGTPAYFKFLEDFMGYAKPAASQDQEGTPVVSAPVTRQERNSGGQPVNGRITLSPEERELAKSLGVTDIDYARQKANFETARRAEPAKYGDR